MTGGQSDGSAAVDINSRACGTGEIGTVGDGSGIIFIDETGNVVHTISVCNAAERCRELISEILARQREDITGGRNYSTSDIACALEIDGAAGSGGAIRFGDEEVRSGIDEVRSGDDGERLNAGNSDVCVGHSTGFCGEGNRAATVGADVVGSADQRVSELGNVDIGVVFFTTVNERAIAVGREAAGCRIEAGGVHASDEEGILCAHGQAAVVAERIDGDRCACTLCGVSRRSCSDGDAAAGRNSRGSGESGCAAAGRVCRADGAAI